MGSISTLRDRKVLVTGAAGFIGNEVCRQLLTAGALVTGVDNLVNGKEENIHDLHGIHFYKLDIRDRTEMRKLISGQDLVLHLACLGVRHSIHSPLENHDVNATSTLHLLDSARSLGVGRFVYVSSSEVYGTSVAAPMDEGHPTLPMTVYGASKLAGERYADAFWRTYNYPTTVVRPFNTFGPRSHHEGDSGEVIPKFLLRALCGAPILIHGDGNQSRDFTFVDDTAAGIISCAISDHTVGETINLGSGTDITLNQLSKLVARVAQQNNLGIEFGPGRPGDVRRLIADVTKARSLVNFKTQIGLEEGLCRLRDWYLARGKPLKELLSEEIPVNWTSPSKSGV
jgi:UDP-glucose 4-epimerase